MGNRVDPYDLGDLHLLMMINTRLLIRTSNSSLIETALPLSQYIGTLAVRASGQERWATPLRISARYLYEKILLTALLSALFAFFSSLLS
jgi:hypothetical protein